MKINFKPTQLRDFSRSKWFPQRYFPYFVKWSKISLFSVLIPILYYLRSSLPVLWPQYISGLFQVTGLSWNPFNDGPLILDHGWKRTVFRNSTMKIINATSNRKSSFDIILRHSKEMDRLEKRGLRTRNPNVI